MKDHFSKPAFRVVSGTYRFGYKLHIVFHLITLPPAVPRWLEVRRPWGAQWKYLLLTSAVTLGLPQFVCFCAYMLFLVKVSAKLVAAKLEK